MMGASPEVNAGPAKPERLQPRKPAEPAKEEIDNV